MILKEYVESGINQFINNGQILFHSTSCGTPFEEYRKEVFDEANRIFAENFDVAGSSEMFGYSLTLFLQRFGWDAARLEKENVTGDSPFIKEVSDDALEAIRKYDLFDIELSRYTESYSKNNLKRAGYALMELIE